MLRALVRETIVNCATNFTSFNIYRYICGSVIHRNDIIVLLKPGTTGMQKNMMSDIHSLLNVYQCNKEEKTSRAM